MLFVSRVKEDTSFGSIASLCQFPAHFAFNQQS